MVNESVDSTVTEFATLEIPIHEQRQRRVLRRREQLALDSGRCV